MMATALRSILLASSLLGGRAAPSVLRLFVSSDGSDSNVGTIADAPLKTITSAQQRLREAITSNELASPAEVHIAPGTYFERLVFTPADSHVKHEIAYIGSGLSTVMSGAQPVTGWQRVDGFSDVFSATLPSSTFPEKVVRQLFSASDMVRRNLTQTATVQYESLSGANPYMYIKAAPGQLAALNVTSASDVEGAIALVYHCWTSDIAPIASINITNSSIVIGPDTVDNFFGASGNRYALQNLQNPWLLQPGTFYFIPSSRVMTYRALPGEDPTDPSKTTLLAPAEEVVLQLNGTAQAPVRNLRFTNITFAHSTALLEEQCNNPSGDGCGGQSGADLNGAAVRADGASGVVFDGIEVTLTGQYGLWLRNACTNVSVTRSWFHDLGAGGVRIGTGSGAEASLTSNVTIADCTVETGGQIVEAGAGILMQEAASNSIVHNHVHHMKYTGIR